MGFSSSVPSLPSTPPPVVTINQDDEYNVAASYNQKTAKRKGLLSTILTRQERSNGDQKTTLG